jgi:hypothetical protein
MEKGAEMISTLQLIAAIATILTGLYSLIAPAKIDGFTGIKTIGQRGISEVRAIFGGTFIGLGIAPFLLSKSNVYPVLGVVYLAIAAVRGISIVVDKSRERSNLISFAVEIAFGVLFLL